MSRTIFVLFVGIDAYPAPVNRLSGCVNDVTRMRDLLAARVSGADDRFVPLVLANEQATRQGIIDAWRSHLGQAGPDDVALFYYSGHGSQENAPPEFWDFEPDRLNETLVCHDSRLPGGWDLADKELAQLISEVAANGPHFAVILDCCHSGSGTRDAGGDVTPRQQMADAPHPAHRQLHRHAAAGGRACRARAKAQPARPCPGPPSPPAGTSCWPPAGPSRRPRRPGSPARLARKNAARSPSTCKTPCSRPARG